MIQERYWIECCELCVSSSRGLWRHRVQTGFKLTIKCVLHYIKNIGSRYNVCIIYPVFHYSSVQLPCAVMLEVCCVSSNKYKTRLREQTHFDQLFGSSHFPPNTRNEIHWFTPFRICEVALSKRLLIINDGDILTHLYFIPRLDLVCQCTGLFKGALMVTFPKYFASKWLH